MDKNQRLRAIAGGCHWTDEHSKNIKGPLHSNSICHVSIAHPQIVDQMHRPLHSLQCTYHNHEATKETRILVMDLEGRKNMSQHQNINNLEINSPKAK